MRLNAVSFNLGWILFVNLGLMASGSDQHVTRPLSFEPNRGQAHGEVEFVARGNGYTIFLAPGRTMFSSRIAGRIQLRLIGAERKTATAEQTLPGVSTYFIGNDREKWRTNLPTYAAIRYHDVYRGVDLLYYGNQGQLEHDFIVAPGSNPAAIRFRLEGAKRIALARNGDLRLFLAGKEMRLLRPVLYQQDGSKRQLVDGGYTVNGNEIAFRIGRYDHGRPLVIDPVALFYSSFLGGSDADSGNAITIDSVGNAYVTGSTASTNFPLRNPGQTTPPAAQTTDAFITKISPAGTVLYSTYLGGSGSDFGTSIAVDSTGSVALAGTTDSTNFPVQSAAQSTNFGAKDAFVTKLTPDGTGLVFSTYLGGASDDKGHGIAIDSQGNTYVTGETQSTNFLVQSGFQSFLAGSDPRPSDAFVTKFTPTGTVVYSTYLGGSGADVGWSIAVDGFGNAYVGGTSGPTANSPFPTTTGAYQFNPTGNGSAGFVTKLNAQGNALVYSTLLGGNDEDIFGIALDSSGNAYVTGQTPSRLFPTLNPVQRNLANADGVFRDAFVTKFDASGSNLIYSTYLGGGDEDSGFSIAVDALGNAYVAGLTRSSNFPIVAAAQPNFGGGTCSGSGGSTLPCSDAFVAQLSAGGNVLVSSTFLGGNDEDQAEGVALDSVGYAHVTGFTRSRNFPTLNPFQPQYDDPFSNPTSDAFVTKLVDPPTINSGGTVNGASFTAGVAPGSIASVFGVKMGPLTFATTVPLPTTLGGVSLRFNNNLATPLFFTSPTQANIQIPWELTGQTTAMVAGSVAAQFGGAVSVPLVQFSPGIFTTNQAGTGQGAIQIANTVIFAAVAGGVPGAQARPASRGEFLTIYCTGLGDVTNRPASGAAARADLLSHTLSNATVTIGGATATVSFAGLSPGFVGLYQVNAQVPNNSPTGSAVPLVLRIGGATSNSVTIAVQ